jgi:hypothetical protein
LTNQYATTEYQFLPEDGAGEEMAEEVGVEPPADGLRARQDGVGRVLTLVAPSGELAQAAKHRKPVSSCHFRPSHGERRRRRPW